MPYPGQYTWVRVRGRDDGGCITPWSAPLALSWEECFPGPPAVVALSPPDGAQGVTVTAGLVVTFNEPVYVGAPQSISADAGQNAFDVPHLTLAPQGGSPVSGTVSVVQAYDEFWAWSLRFQRTPPCGGCGATRLAELTTYQGQVEAARDSHGNKMEPAQVWTFTTGDFTPPHVTGIEPAGGAFGQPGNVVLSAYFGEPLAGTDGVIFDLLGPEGSVDGLLTYEELPGGGDPDPTTEEEGGRSHRACCTMHQKVC